MSIAAFKPVSKELLDAKAYMSLSEREQKNIKKARFVPPQIGRSGFGSFEVEYIVSKLVRENEPA